jgi:DNA-binding beta-propeller fold protein YncE
MQRTIKIVPIMVALLASVSAQAADVKPFKHLLSIYSDDKELALKSPEGVACNDKSELVVADTGNGRLLKYKFQGGNLSGGTEIKSPQTSYPIRVQLDSKGQILVLDEKLQRIATLAPNGAFVSYLEPQGIPAPQKIVPRSFKLDGKDNIYLIDIAGQRVLALDAAGKYLRQLPFPKDRRFFADLTVNGNGDVFLLDPVDPAVFVAAKGSATFAPLTKNLKEYVDFPTYIASDAATGSLYLVDEHGQAVVSLGQDGSFLARRLVMGWKEGQLNYPQQICPTGNLLFIADRDNSRVQIFEISH